MKGHAGCILRSSTWRSSTCRSDTSSPACPLPAALVPPRPTPRPCCPLPRRAEHVLRDQPVPDLHAGATSLSGLLRSGLGRFGLQAGPKPSDCSTVILFVVGGISVAGGQLVHVQACMRCCGADGWLG